MGKDAWIFAAEDRQFLIQQLSSAAADIDMDLTEKPIIKDLLKKHGAKAEKYLGQHFILSKKALVKMITAAEIEKNDTIIEVGPGLGALTQELAKIPHPLKKGGGPKIIAIEKDPLMIDILKETLADYKNIKIIQADARNLVSISEIDTDGEKLGISVRKAGYKIVANLPYNIATFLIHQWLEGGNPSSPRLRRTQPAEIMVLMIQKEVAQRICSKPPHMNLLAVSVQFYADAKIIDYVPAEAFWPKPKVDSAIIKIVPKSLPAAQASLFFSVVKVGFSQPRKQLIGNLFRRLNLSKEDLLKIFKKLNISEHVRAENLNMDQWLKLASQVIHN